MKTSAILILFFLLFCFENSAQVPSLQFQKPLGGTKSDKGYCIAALADGTYVIAGEADSWNGNMTGNHGPADIWLAKLDSSLNVIWQKSLGGSNGDGANSVQQTFDGGFILLGYTNSDDGDVSGLHIDFAPRNDYWVVKTDSLGNIQWQKCLGGTFWEEGYEVKQTSDSGYVLIGKATSGDGDVTNHHGYCSGCEEDFWVVKLDQSGNIQWEQAYGASGMDVGVSISQTLDGGYIAAGYTASTDSDVVGNHGATDAWVLRLDSSGAVIWKNCYGGPLSETAESIIEAGDGGFIFAGWAEADGGDVSGSHGGGDFWIVKLNSAGILQWQKCLGGSGPEVPGGIQKTNDNGFIIAGDADSNDGDVSGGHGAGDFWIVKIDSIGNIQWQKCLGGSDADVAYEVRQTPDSGFVAIGYTRSNDGDVSGLHTPCSWGVASCDDYWVVKLGPISTRLAAPPNTITDFAVYQNPLVKSIDVSFYANGNEKENVQLIDITGRILLQDAFAATNGLNKHRIFTGDLGGGIYFVRLQGGGEAVTKKVAIQ